MPWTNKQINDEFVKLLTKELEKKNLTLEAFKKLPKYEQSKIIKVVQQQKEEKAMAISGSANFENVKTAAKNYIKFMLGEFKGYKKEKKIDPSIKSPLQLPKKQQKEFYAIVKKKWSATKKDASFKSAELTTYDACGYNKRASVMNVLEQVLSNKK